MTAFALATVAEELSGLRKGSSSELHDNRTDRSRRVVVKILNQVWYLIIHLILLNLFACSC